MQHRELSGAFSDEAKWSDCWKQLSTKNSVGTLRIYHNSPAQLEGTARSLSNNSSVHHLEVGIVEGLEAVIALGNLLQVSTLFACTAALLAGAGHFITELQQLTIMQQGLTACEDETVSYSHGCLLSRPVLTTMQRGMGCTRCGLPPFRQWKQQCLHTALRSTTTVPCPTSACCATCIPGPQSTKSIQTLVIQHLRDSVEPAAAASSTPNSAQAAINSLTATADAAASSGATQPAAAAEVLFQGLAANSTITSLTLHKLQPAQVHLLATALAQGGCAGQLQQLHLPNAR